MALCLCYFVCLCIKTWSQMVLHWFKLTFGSGFIRCSAERCGFLNARSTCLFLFFVPSQWWLIACPSACFSAFGVFQHLISFPLRAFRLHHFLFVTFPSPASPAVPPDMKKYLKICLQLLFSFPPPEHQLQLWDTAGQERFRKSMVQHYYRNVHAVLFVYDVTSPASFRGLMSWIEECRQNSLGQEIPR